MKWLTGQRLGEIAKIQTLLRAREDYDRPYTEDGINKILYYRSQMIKRYTTIYIIQEKNHRNKRHLSLIQTTFSRYIGQIKRYSLSYIC